MRVLICPPSEAARQSLECLSAWSRAGLLDPFCWWEIGSDPGDPDLNVVAVRRGDGRQMLLAEALLDSQPEDVALVAFCPGVSSGPIDGSFAQAVEAKLDAAREVLAYQTARPAECAMVVAPAAIAMPVPRELFRAEWSANVYVAPEDRDDPQGVNALAANESRLPAHAAHAIATIADLWRSSQGNEQSTLEILRDRQPAIAPAPVQVVRCFTRGIDAGYLADHVAESVFMPGSSWPNPQPEKFDRVNDATALVAAGARAFMVKHQDVLGASEFEPYELPKDEKLGLFEALKRIIGIVWDRIRRRPYELVVAKVHGVHDWMAAKVEAIDGGATGLKIRRAGEKAREGGQTVELEEVLERPLFVPEGPVANTWSDLRGLAFCLVDGRGLPAELGEGLVERGAKRALVTEPLLIAPDPQIGYSLVRGDREAPACDPLNEDPSMKPDEPKQEPEVESPSESLPSTDAAAEAEVEAPAEVASLAEPAVPAETRSVAEAVKPEPTMEYVADPNPPNTSLQETATGTSPSQESKLERQPAPDVADQASPGPVSAGKSHIAVDMPAADASELLDEPTDAENKDESDSNTEDNRASRERPWLTPESAVIDLDEELEEDPDTVRARSSLLWLVGLRLARNLKKAQAQAESLRAAEDSKLDPESKEAKELAEAEKTESMKRSRGRIRGLIKTAAITFGLSILVALLAWDLPWLVTTPVWGLPLPVRVPVLLLIPVIWLLAMAYQARKLLIRERRESREIAQREIDELNQKMLASIREGDAVRLGRRYNEFMDWAEIVGWYVHRPWIGEPLEQLDIDASIPRGTRPVAFQMAIGESDSDWLAELGAITRSHVFKPGWLNDLYSINQDEVLKTAAGPSRFVSGATSELSSDPAADMSDDLESPRRNLLRGVRRGDYRHVGDNAMTIDLLNRLDGLPLDSAATKVELVSSQNGGTEPLPLSPTWFSAPPNLESLIRRLTPSVIRLTATVGGRHAVGTGVLLEGEELVATAFHVIEGSDSIAAQLANGDLVVATVESVSPESDLAILRLASRVPMLGAVLAADGKLDQGTPVVTLGFQVANEGEPTFSWGLVTATGRTVSSDDVGEGVETVEANYQSAAGASGSPVFNLDGEVVGLHAGSSQAEPQGAGPSHVSHAIPAGLVRTLVEDGSTRSVPRWNANPSTSAAAQGPARRRQVTGTSPSEFFNDLFGSADKQAFLPGHWVLAGSSAHNAVDQVLASPHIVDVSTTRISDYCEGNEFLRPLRLMVHRIDMSAPAAPDTLSSCEDR